MGSQKKDKGKHPSKARKKSSGPKPPPPKKFPPVRFASKAPPPIKPVGGGTYVWRPSRDPHRTFTANQPMRVPHVFPNHLRPRLELAITDAGKDFPLVSQTRQRVGKIISHVGQSVCVAARDGQLRPDLALSALQSLLDCLSHYYYEHSYSNRESYDLKLKREIGASEEWRGFLVELKELAESRKLHVGQESEPKPKATVTTEAGRHESSSPTPRQDEPAPPQPADSTDGENRAGTKRRAVEELDALTGTQEAGGPEFPTDLENTQHASPKGSRRSVAPKTPTSVPEDGVGDKRDDPSWKEVMERNSYSHGEAAQILKVATRTIRRWIKKGMLKQDPRKRVLVDTNFDKFYGKAHSSESK